MLFDLDGATLIARSIVLIIAFTVHEFAHAWTANHFGDDTPRINGRLTLNPLAHLDPLGSLLLLVVGFGWAKPVPVNPYLLRRRSSAALMWVSLAGPASNLLLAILAAIPFRLGLVSASQAYQDAFLNTTFRWLPSLPQILIDFVFINLLLMLFNLIPLSPLDGDKVFDYFLPPPLAKVWEMIRPYGPLILMAVVFIGPSLLKIDILGKIIYPPLFFLLSLLIG